MTITIINTRNQEISLEDAIEMQDEDMRDDAGQTIDMINGYEPVPCDFIDEEYEYEKYMDAKACARDWNTPPEYR